MSKIFLSVGLLAGMLTSAHAQQVVVQFGPTTEYSTIDCSVFTKLPDGAWKALAPKIFSLGFVENIVPPRQLIKSGGFIYNNIDLYSQLNAQCGGGALVTARY